MYAKVQNIGKACCNENVWTSWGFGLDLQIALKSSRLLWEMRLVVLSVRECLRISWKIGGFKSPPMLRAVLGNAKIAQEKSLKGGEKGLKVLTVA